MFRVVLLAPALVWTFYPKGNQCYVYPVSVSVLCLDRTDSPVVRATGWPKVKIQCIEGSTPERPSYETSGGGVVFNTVPDTGTAMTSERWGSRLGFLLATVGAAVGLGNIWRFSAVVGQNGGGAYLVPYLIAAFVCAVPLLVLELSVGRRLRTDVKRNL